MKVARKIQKMEPSLTVEITSQAMAMRKQGLPVISFSAGEPDFPTPTHIKQAAVEALEQGYTKYTPTGGLDEVKEAICSKLQRDNDLHYETSQIIASCGAKHSLFNTLYVTCDEGDEVIIPAPYWVSYAEQVKLAGAKPIVVPTKESNFRLTAEQLRRALSPRTRAVILNSPNNPTGTVYDREELAALAEVAVAADLLLISDEIYEKIIYDRATHYSIAAFGPQIKDRTVVINGMSKAYAMTGWRLGYAAGPQEIITAMAKFQSQSVHHPTTMTQRATVVALNSPHDFLKDMVAEFDRRRRYVVERLNRLAGISCPVPEGAFYAFPKVAAYFGSGTDGWRINHSHDLARYLLQEMKVATVPGSGFGAEGFIRLSYAISMEAIKEGLARIEEGLARLH